MKVKIIKSLSEIDSKTWDRLVQDNNPFLKHAFLSALETHDCVGERFGWLPQHLLILSENDKLVGACPMYLKFNSYGEFVFDWAWADAYQRAGGEYYPKLVSAIPYTPATGQRLLVSPECNKTDIQQKLIQAAIHHAEAIGASTVHWLFPQAEDGESLANEHVLSRIDIQFHWRNQDYKTFDHYLSFLSSRKRKKIRKERAQVYDAGIKLKVLTGTEMTHEDWKIMFQFYASTFIRKSGMPTFNIEFFESISRSMGDQVILVFAYKDNKCVAGAIMYRSDNALYGRHWGCLDNYRSLHFEACYYQGLEYCIEKGLQLFEPGAQGEHKISRGFLPVITESYHWIAHPDFKDSLDRHLRHERAMIGEYFEELQGRSPFRKPN